MLGYSENRVMKGSAGFDPETVIIGSQIWMSVNLDIDDGGDGICVYADDYNNLSDYGLLYSWDAAVRISEKLDGWHLPTDEEWKVAEMYLGMSQAEADDKYWRGTDEASKMAGTSLWADGALTQSSVFGSSGLNLTPGGYTVDCGVYPYQRLNTYGYYWTSTENGETEAWYRLFRDRNTDNYRREIQKYYNHSVRLIKD